MVAVGFCVAVVVGPGVVVSFAELAALGVAVSFAVLVALGVADSSAVLVALGVAVSFAVLVALGVVVSFAVLVALGVVVFFAVAMELIRLMYIEFTKNLFVACPFKNTSSQPTHSPDSMSFTTQTLLPSGTLSENALAASD